MGTDLAARLKCRQEPSAKPLWPSSLNKTAVYEQAVNLAAKAGNRERFDCGSDARACSSTPSGALTFC